FQLNLDPNEIRLLTKIVAPLTALAFVYINYRGASETGKVGALFTLGQMTFVGIIAVVGIVMAVAQPDRLANFQPFMHHKKGWGEMLTAMGMIYVAFEGFEVIAQAGDETIDPKRNIPKAMLYSVLIVCVLYVAVSFATVTAIRPDATIDGARVDVIEWISTRGTNADGETGFGEAIERLMPFGGLVVTLAVIFSATSALNATIYSATRASYALGRDRMLPGFFSRISPRRKTPWVALLFTGAIVLVVAGLLPTRDVAGCASMMFLFLFLLVNLCVIKIRTNMGDELSYGFVMPLFPVFPIAAILIQMALAYAIIHASWLAWVIAPVWIVAGLVMYLAYSRTRAVPTADEIAVLEERPAPPGPGYRVMVAVANPANALQLVTNTHRLCEAKGARVEVLHMVPVPDQVPLTDAKDYMAAGKEGVIEMMMSLGLEFPISTTIRYCRNIARGIVSAVRSKKINMLIMGWHGQAGSALFKLGSKVDPVVERAPCNVVMFKNCGGGQRYKRILVPVAGGPNAAFAVEVANILADREEGQVVAFTVARGEGGFDVSGFLAENADRITLPAGRVTGKIVVAEDVVEAILAEAEDYDMIVLGFTREPVLHRLTHETIPETVAKRCDKPLVMVKAPAGLRSWIRRWV
ncbi:MAG: amino acid permease, partial [Planctomycetota bacterium]